MDQRSLVTVLAKKYNIDVSTPEGAMALYNKLCVIVEVEKKYKDLSKLYAETVSLQNKKAGILSRALIEILYSDKLSPNVKGKIKKITKDYDFEITVNGGEIKLSFPGLNILPD